MAEEVTAASAIKALQEAATEICKGWTKADWEAFYKRCQYYAIMPTNVVFPEEGGRNNG